MPAKSPRASLAKRDDLTTMVTTPRRAGRRPSGPGGTKVSDYPHVMIRLPHATKSTLDALSAITGVPMWQLVDRAVNHYVANLPAGEKKLVADVRLRRRARSEN